MNQQFLENTIWILFIIILINAFIMIAIFSLIFKKTKKSKKKRKTKPKKYTKKQEKIFKLLRNLMDKHNLKHWDYGLGYGKRTLGYCHYQKEKIVLSKHLIKNYNTKTVKIAILHEIAHALTPGEHHNKVWKKMCKDIGGDGSRTLKTY